MSECERKGRWVNGFRFEARFDVGPPSASFDTKGHWSPGEVVRLAAITKPKTYVRDVCTTCGRTIERQGAS